MKVLKELNEGKYERTMVSQQEKGTKETTIDMSKYVIEISFHLRELELCSQTP